MFIVNLIIQLWFNFFRILDEPSKPKDVEVVDWDKDHADLKWTKPENDGGAPITGYVIEYKVIALNFEFYNNKYEIL
jgi:hypothetical protein